MKNKYSVADLVNELINEYELPHERKVDKKTGKEIIDNSAEIWKNYRQQVSRALHSEGIWDNAIISQKGKKQIRYFTDQQKQLLFNSKYIYNYINKNSDNKEYQNRKSYKQVKKEVQKTIDQRREDYIEYLSSLDMDKEDISAPILTDKEFFDYKLLMMVNALFHMHFTPINNDLLRNDIYHYKYLIDNMNLSEEDLLVEKRLANPEGNYYHKKKK